MSTDEPPFPQAGSPRPESQSESQSESQTGRFTRWVIRRRAAVLVAAAALAVAAGLGARHLGLSTDYRTFFSDDNPELLAYEAVEDIYSRSDNALFVVRPKEGDLFTPRTLGVIRELTEAAWQIPHSTRVDAVTNFQHTFARSGPTDSGDDGDELVVEDLLPDGPIDAAAVERLRRVALAEPLLVGRLLSPDGTTAGINVRISLPGESVDELPAMAAHVRRLEADFRRRYPDLDIHVTGIAMLNMAFADAPLADATVVMPLMFAALVVGIVLVLRSLAGTLGTLAVILLSTATAVGVAGHLGVFFDPTSASAPTIILTLAVADSVHILISFLQARRRGVGRDASIVEAMVLNARPVFLTSVTTAIGFLTLNFSDSPPFRLLGNVTAFGVMAAWLFSVTVLPAALACTRDRRLAAPGPSRVDGLIAAFADLVVRHHRPILAVVTLLVVALGALVPTLRINDRYFDYFSHALPIRTGTDFATQHLSGVYTASFHLDSGTSQGVTDPAFLRTVDDFTAWLEARPAVAHVNSFSHTMRRLNRNLHGDDPAYHRLPDSHDLAAQYLLLYEMSLPYGLDVNDQINVDRSALRLDVTFDDVDIATVESETIAAQDWLREHGAGPLTEARGTGPAQMFAKITRRNIESMVGGTVLGFGLIALILTLSLRSLRLGVISLIPNIVPTGMAFGIWALYAGEVGFAVSVIAGLAIGIIVDDTVHFLSKYNHVRHRLPAADAVRHAFTHVGPAILANTAIVSVGFAMLGLSTFRVTAYMGLLTSLTVLCALVVDLLLLPALLLALDRRPVRGAVAPAAPVAPLAAVPAELPRAAALALAGD